MPTSPTRRDWLAATSLSLAACSPAPKPDEFSIAESAETLGGHKALTLRRAASPTGDTPLLLEAEILPGRGFNTWQLRAYLPGKGVTDLFTAPSLNEAAKLMTAGENDFRGNESFKNGGAILVPFANRIRGKFDEKARTIETIAAGKSIKLPANWKGKNAGAEPHAMHGLLLDQPTVITRRVADANGATLEANWRKPFHNEWPGAAKIQFHAALTTKSFVLKVTAINMGNQPLPIGIGWHPYFNIPSGDRRQAKLKIPASTRALVDNYDNVFPTGVTEPTAGSAFDFRQPRAMGDQFLDDCFLDLIQDSNGAVTAEIHDPAAHYSVKITSASPAVKAYQCYAPPDKPFIVLEPQFNIGDPFNKAIWKDRDTGIVLLAPNHEVVYDATVEISRI
ncbi:MAG: aldose 1-epimerase [Bryobacteraceae bacterium]